MYKPIIGGGANALGSLNQNFGGAMAPVVPAAAPSPMSAVLIGLN